MERNPFRPGVGLAPAYLAGRQGEMRRFRSSLRSAPEIPANIRLTGLRGIGKTVLLSEFEKIAVAEGWATLVLELEPRHNNEIDLTRTLTAQAGALVARLSRAARIRGRVASGVTAARQALTVTLQDVTYSLGGDVAGEARELVEALLDLVEAALRVERRGVAVLIDEAQVLRDDKDRAGEHPLSLLIACVAGMQKHHVPISLVLCGLPTLTVNLLAARTYSERMFKGEEVSELDPAESRAAFTEPLRTTTLQASPELVQRVLETVRGYPYFIQLWGAELWDAAADSDLSRMTEGLLDEVEPDIYRRLDLDFYDPRVQSLTPAEQDLLADAATCNYPPLVTADLNQRSVKSGANVNVLLGRLVTANVVYRERKGQYLYTAPGFDDYLRRRFRS